MKLTDLSAAHKGQKVRINYDHPTSQGILTDIRREDRPLSDDRLAGPSDTREAYVLVEIEGQWLPWLRGRSYEVEIVD